MMKFFIIVALLRSSAALAGSPPDFAKSCLAPSRIQSPDQSASFTEIDRNFAGAVQVMQYKGATTDRSANFGAIAFFTDSVENDNAFFERAFRFYSELKKIDQEDVEHLGAIDETAKLDVYALALKHSNNNPYIALKLLAVYGHDNIGTALYPQGCRSTHLNTVGPLLNSQLYKPGSLSGIQYPTPWVEKGLEIGKNCNAIDEVKLIYRRLCDDNQDKYQADYYHVIASAFLACRNRVVKNKIPSLVALDFLTDKAFYFFETQKVKEYKIERFREEVTMGVSDSSSPMFRGLNKGLDNIAEGKSEILPADEIALLDANDQAALKAILARYKFEVDFRQEQHRMGLAFGAKACKDIYSFAITDPKVCAHCPP